MRGAKPSLFKLEEMAEVTENETFAGALHHRELSV
jgi:hypothetical protein